MREFDDDVTSSPYSRKVGDRLRVIRRQKRLSSRKWSRVRRGSSIRARRLRARRAGHLRAPPGAPGSSTTCRWISCCRGRTSPSPPTPTLSRTEAGDRPAEAQQWPAVRDAHPVLEDGQVQRQDFNGKVITVRGGDARAMRRARRAGGPGQRLGALDLLYRPEPAAARPLPASVGRDQCAGSPASILCPTRCDYCAFATWTDARRRPTSARWGGHPPFGAAAGDECVRRRRYAGW